MKPYLVKVYVNGCVYRYTGLFARTGDAIKFAIKQFHGRGPFSIYAGPAK